MAAYRRVYDSRHLQADCQEPPAPELYARLSSISYLFHHSVYSLACVCYPGEHQYEILDFVAAKFHEELGVFKLLVIMLTTITMATTVTVVIVVVIGFDVAIILVVFRFIIYLFRECCCHCRFKSQANCHHHLLRGVDSVHL